MKFVLCRECHGIAIPERGSVQPANCPCEKCGALYTGNKNEMAVIGPCTILGMADETWGELLDPATDENLVMATIYTIRKSASTILEVKDD